MDLGLKPWKIQRCSLRTMAVSQARTHRFPAGKIKLILALDKITVENYKLYAGGKHTHKRLVGRLIYTSQNRITTSRIKLFQNNSFLIPTTLSKRLK